MSDFFEVSAAAGRTIERMRVYTSAEDMREVHLAFTDGTEMVVEVDVQVKFVAKHYQPTPSGPEWLSTISG